MRVQNIDMYSLSIKIAVVFYSLSYADCAFSKAPPLIGRFPPVFTPMDDTGAVNVSVIPQYAKYLKYCGIDGLVVAALAGEGFNLAVSEKKKLLDSWIIAARPYGLKVIMMVGAVPGPDTLELTRYAALVRVDAIIALPTLSYYGTSLTPKELVEYIELLAKTANSLPIYYHHEPEITGTTVDLAAFFKLASNKVPQFKGIKADLPSAMQVVALNKLRSDQTIIIFKPTSISGAALMGYDSFNLIVTNTFPGLVKDIINNARSGEVAKARRAQKKLNTLVAVISAQGEYIAAFKTATEIITGIRLGRTRLPLQPISKRGVQNIIDILEEANIDIAF